MLTVQQCAQRACVCESLVRAWLRQGLLPHYRMSAAGGKGGKILVQECDLDGLLASFKVGAPPPPLPKPPPQPPLKHIKL